MLRLAISLSILIFCSSVLHAEIITVSNSGAALATAGQSREVVTDYLALKLLRETVDRAVAHIKTAPEFRETQADVEDIKFITVLVSRVSTIMPQYFLDEKGRDKVTLQIKLEIDPITVNRYLEKALENNQFKAFGRKYLENVLSLETKLLSLKVDKEYKLKKEVIALFGIQRARAYEMNELSRNAFNETSTSTPAEKKISDMKDKFISALLKDMSSYHDNQQENVQKLLMDAESYSKERLTVLKSIEQKYIEMPYQFNISKSSDVISAKNEIITTRKKIQNIAKSFFYDTDVLRQSIYAAYDNITLYLESVKFYEVDPIKDRWESSYHYDYRLNNYQLRIHDTDRFVANNQKRIYEMRYRAEKVLKINSLLSLLKILQPYENHLRELQNEQYEGASAEDAYVMKVGPADPKTAKLKILIRFLGDNYNLDFDVAKADANKVKYFIDYARFFVAHPLYRLTSAGADPYDIDLVQSGFIIIHRGDKSQQIFLTNPNIQPFPESLYSDDFKQLLMKEKNELKYKSSEIINPELASLYPMNNDQYFAQLSLTRVAADSSARLYAQNDIKADFVGDPPPKEDLVSDESASESIATAQDSISTTNTTNNLKTDTLAGDNLTLIDNETATGEVKPNTNTTGSNNNVSATDNISVAADFQKLDPENPFAPMIDTDGLYSIEKELLLKLPQRRVYLGSISLLLGSSAGLGKGSNSNYKKSAGLFGVKGQYHIGYFAVEPAVVYLESGPARGSLSSYKITRFDYFVSFLFQYPIYVGKDMILLPYIGPGVGLSRMIFKTIPTEDETIKEKFQESAFMLSAKLGLKYAYSNLLLGVGFQFNMVNPVVRTRTENFSNYSVFFEIGYAILSKR